MSTQTIARERNNRSALVVGLARNAEGAVANGLANIASALTPFDKVSWLIIESDSDDGTAKRLAELSRTVANFEFRSLGRLRDKIPQRTARIAYCRNEYLRELFIQPQFANVDFVIVADLDGINTRLTAHGIESCFVREDWSVCTANQLGPYYDIWALRHPQWCPVDCWDTYHFLRSCGLSNREAHYRAILMPMISIPPGNTWIEVDSAFGGFAIYRRNALRGVAYSGLTPEGKEICEHTTLHAQIRARSQRIFINPALVNSEFTPMTESLKLHRRIRMEIARLLDSSSLRATDTVKRSTGSSDNYDQS